MKRSLTAALALVGVLATGEALAVGVSYGLRLGTGTGLDRDDKLGDASVFPFVVGPAIKLALPVLEVEIDALYWSTTTEAAGIEFRDNDLALPVIARASFPLIPLVFDLQLGLGVEPRFHLSASVDGGAADADDDHGMLLYLPICVGGELSVGGTALTVEIRYEYRITEPDEGEAAIDYLTFFGGVFF